MANPYDSQKCGNCRFYVTPPLERIREEPAGCHHAPPQTFLVPAQGALGQVQMQVASFWPPVREDHWCGEWKPRDPN